MLDISQIAETQTLFAISCFFMAPATCEPRTSGELGLIIQELYLGRLEVFPVVVHGGDLRPQLGNHYLESTNQSTVSGGLLTNENSPP